MAKHNQEITHGSEVTLHFTLSTLDGTEAASTFGEEPSTLIIGDGGMVQGLEMALYGLKPGDRQTLTLEPGQAYGPRDEEKIHSVPRASFPGEMELEPGLIIGFETPGGDEVAGIVLELEGDQVKVDFNHPLAGHNILFKVEILEVKNP